MDMTEIKRFEVATGKIKLSEAIRIGAKMHPQGSAYYDTDEGSTCALGAAAFGSGYPGYEGGTPSGWICRIWPDLPHPIELQIHGRNACRESRESIADWLERQGL